MSDVLHTIHFDDLDFISAHPLGSTGMKEFCDGITFFDGLVLAPLFPVGSTLLHEQSEAVLTEGA